MKSEPGPFERAETMLSAWPSSSSVCVPVWVRQVYCWSTGRLKHSGLGFRLSVRASRFECSSSAAFSPAGTFFISSRYLSVRACSKPASVRSWEARTKMPGRPLTAERRVEKSPPVSGARKSKACWASGGTVTMTPSSTTRFCQVSTRVNQVSGGGLVVPRRKATIRR